MYVIALIIIILVIAVPIYLCYENTDMDSENSKKVKVIASILLHGFLGLFLSLILFYLLSSLLPICRELPLVTTIIILCSIICGCTAWIVETIKNNTK